MKLKLISEPEAENMFGSQPCGKPHVVRSLFVTYLPTRS
jgi:hypothetical protein